MSDIPYAGPYIAPRLKNLKATLAQADELIVATEDEAIASLRRERELDSMTQGADDALRDKYNMRRD